MHNLSSNAIEQIKVLASLKWGLVEIHDKVWKTNLKAMLQLNNDLSANDKLLLSVFCRKNMDFVSHFKFLTLWLGVRGISSNGLQSTKRIWKRASTQAESSLFRTHYTMWGQQWWVEDSSGILKLKLLCFCHWIIIGLCGLLGDSNENKPLVGAEEEEVAKMGCPSLGEHTQVEVVIEESYEFKVSLCTNCTYVLTCVHIFFIKKLFRMSQRQISSMSSLVKYWKTSSLTAIEPAALNITSRVKMQIWSEMIESECQLSQLRGWIIHFYSM